AGFANIARAKRPSQPARRNRRTHVLYEATHLGILCSWPVTDSAPGFNPNAGEDRAAPTRDLEQSRRIAICVQLLENVVRNLSATCVQPPHHLEANIARLADAEQIADYLEHRSQVLFSNVVRYQTRVDKGTAKGVVEQAVLCSGNIRQARVKGARVWS